MTTWQWILIGLGWFACGALAVWMGRTTFDPWYILVAFFFGGPLSIGFVLFMLLLMMGSI